MSTQTLTRSTERLERAVASHAAFEITPTGGALGAIVTGLDARQLRDPDHIFRLKRALDEHLILIFKNQQFTEDEQVAFATLFGPVFRSETEVPVAGWKDGKTPDVVVFAESGAPNGGAFEPHIDHKWTPYPSSGSFLYAISVPSHDGETTWTNLVRAYEELDRATKERIADLELLTWNPFVRNRERPRTGYRPVAIYPPEGPLFAHPLVRTHPSSGKKILFLDGSTEVELVGVEPHEGEALITQLRLHLAQPHLSYTHKWAVGDVVWWDNQTTQHARNGWDQSETRLLKRVSIGGGRPF